jgi:hypothetical protein
LDTFSYVLWSADVTVKEVNHIRCFAIDIAKDFILLSCRLKFISLTTIQVKKRTKDIKERGFGSASYKHYIRRA